jgi:hypothetical protein
VIFLGAFGFGQAWVACSVEIGTPSSPNAASVALLAVVGPGAIAAATAAAGQRRDQVREALGRDLEAARYAVGT